MDNHLFHIFTIMKIFNKKILKRISFDIIIVRMLSELFRIVVFIRIPTIVMSKTH